jgi:hypothetical protein
MPIADIDPLELLTEDKTAARTGLSVHTLAKHRKLGKGIPFVRLGRTIRYRTADVERYLIDHRVEPGKSKPVTIAPLATVPPADANHSWLPHLRPRHDYFR